LYAVEICLQIEIQKEKEKDGQTEKEQEQEQGEKEQDEKEQYHFDTLAQLCVTGHPQVRLHLSKHQRPQVRIRRFE
jgi:hypothetical protein